jgi:autotransporter-associated beta strand protein
VLFVLNLFDERSAMNHSRIRGLLLGLTACGAIASFGALADAATYTWTKTAAGTYSFANTGGQDNWGTGAGGAFPNAIDDIAAMDTLDLTGAQSVTFDQPITLGELRWADMAPVPASTTTHSMNFNNSGGTGSLTFKTTTGNAKIVYGRTTTGGASQRNSTSINIPVTLDSDTEIILDLQSSGSRNLYFNTGALSGSGNIISNSATRGTLAFFTDTYDLSNYTGTIKYTSHGSNGNFLQLAGNTAGAARNLRQTTLEMAVTTAGGNVCIFDAQPGAILELGALRGDGLIVPFTNKDTGFNLLTGTLRTGYLSGTNTYSGVISSVARFPADGDLPIFNYEKVGTSSTQIFTGNNIYNGTTTVTEGTLLVNGTHAGGSTYSVASGATLGGTGSIGTSTVTIDAGGILAPGGSIESFDVAGAAINGKLLIEYQGASIDVLNVSGNLDITNATVDFSSLGAVTAGPHVFATYSSLSGTAFATVLNQPAGATIDYNYLGQNQIALITLASLHPGDFDSDGDVDGADFVAWQTNFPKPSGATLAQGDADGDGDVDGADFVVWQTYFPFTPGPGAAPVPEPGTAMLFIIGGAAVLAASRRTVLA